jgi:hypothetical protein
LADEPLVHHAQVAAKQAIAKTGWFAREPDWHFSAMLVLEMLFVFIAIPALTTGEADRNLVNLLQLGLVATAIALIVQSNWLRLGLGASFGLSLVARYLPGSDGHTATLALVLIYNMVLTAVVSRAVFGPGVVNHHRIAGAIFVYLNIALLFAVAYALLNLATPGAIAGLPPDSGSHAYETLHFSLTTLTSIGDGQVVPKSPLACSLTDLETIIGQLFPPLLLSRLVGLHLSRARDT